MQLQPLPHSFSVCRVTDFSLVDRGAEFCFTARTDEEHSLVCPAADVPANCTHREDGWRAFRITGVLDFSLVGILARISALLADARIGIFAVSTYNTDYIFVKEENFPRALDVLSGAGYEILPEVRI